jgi:ketosteroid isomerase-like protein
MRVISAVRSSVVVAVVVAAGLVACATTGDRGPLDELANAERAFAASATSVGVKAAFLGVLDDDAIVFRPGPVNGREYIAAHPDAAYQLVWQPNRVAVSASGDLGYTSGPYRLTTNAKPARSFHGDFFTVWRRGPDGRWRVLMDHGNGHDGEADWDMPLARLAGDGTTTTRSAEDVEADFARISASEGVGSAYRRFGSPSLRRLRDEAKPFDGAPAPSEDARWTWTRTTGGAARANDLAWASGRYRTGSGTGAVTGVYVRVWRAERGEWKILADLATPIDAPAS